MKPMTLGMMIAEARKAKGMTQLDLAAKMNVTDKAVSKWERDLSRPDIDSIPRLAEALDIPAEKLLRRETGNAGASRRRSRIAQTVRLVARCVALAMGVAVVALSALGALAVEDGLLFLGIGLASLALSAILQAED